MGRTTKAFGITMGLAGLVTAAGFVGNKYYNNKIDNVKPSSTEISRLDEAKMYEKMRDYSSVGLGLGVAVLIVGGLSRFSAQPREPGEDDYRRHVPEHR